MIEEIIEWFCADIRRIVAIPIVGWFYLKPLIYRRHIKIGDTYVDTELR
jgi:hypothetical protein